MSAREGVLLPLIHPCALLSKGVRSTLWTRTSLKVCSWSCPEVMLVQLYRSALRRGRLYFWLANTLLAECIYDFLSCFCCPSKIACQSKLFFIRMIRRFHIWINCWVALIVCRRPYIPLERYELSHSFEVSYLPPSFTSWQKDESQQFLAIMPRYMCLRYKHDFLRFRRVINWDETDDKLNVSRAINLSKFIGGQESGSPRPTICGLAFAADKNRSFNFSFLFFALLLNSVKLSTPPLLRFHSLEKRNDWYESHHLFSTFCPNRNP